MPARPFFEKMSSLCSNSRASGCVMIAWSAGAHRWSGGRSMPPACTATGVKRVTVLLVMAMFLRV
eukprot:5154026-Prymnesium_polylepis.1